MEQLVLGTGLSGLITGYIMGWPVVGENLGGQQSASFPLGPRILEKTEDTTWLLQQLRIYQSPRTFTIGYQKEFGRLTGPDAFSPEATDSFREMYYKKTRGIDEVSESCLSGGRNRIVGWDLRDIPFVKKLATSVIVLRGRVGRIIKDGNPRLYLTKPRTNFELNLIVTELERIQEFNQIINTFPLPTFLRLLGESEYAASLISLPTFFVKVHSMEVLFDYDYVYIGDPNLAIHRITRLTPHDYVLECRGDVISSAGKLLKEHLPHYERDGLGSSKHLTYINHLLVPDCQIVKSKGLREFEGVTMVGRYAEWDHRIKLEDVIRRARGCREGLSGRR